MDAITLAADSAAASGMNWEAWIVISNMLLVFVTVAAIVIDNKIMIKAIVRIVTILAPSKKAACASCGKHRKAEVVGNVHTV